MHVVIIISLRKLFVRTTEDSLHQKHIGKLFKKMPNEENNSHLYGCKSTYDVSVPPYSLSLFFFAFS